MPPAPGSAKKKVVLIGDGGVGKTSLIRKYVFDQFSDDYLSTIGTKITQKEMKVGQHDVKLMIWDILGQKGFSAVQTTALAGAHGALLVFDMTSKDSLTSLQDHWIPLLNKAVGTIPMVVLGNKADLEDNMEVESVWMAELAELHNSTAMPTSAKTGLNVEKAFLRIAHSIAPRQAQKGAREAPSTEQMEVTTPVEAADFLISDFCHKYGDQQLAMNIIRKQFSQVGVNIDDVDRSQLKQVLLLLEKIETSYKGQEQARKNKQYRMKIMGRILQDQPLERNTQSSNV